MKQNDLINQGQNVIMNTYKQFPIVLERGENCYLLDVEGKKYLDFVAGVAVNCLGYNNDKLTSNLISQMLKLYHCSNLYWNIPQIELAELLVKNSSFDKVFFCNSGAESIEAALKLARKYGKISHGQDCYEIITMEQSFHGRTFGAITATGQEKYQKDFKPLLPGIKYAEFNNFDSVNELVSKKTCAILVEPVQGEGGIRPAEKEFLQNLRNLCDQKNIVLIFDEVQTGIGRTGKLFAYENYDVIPDIITLAKGLGGGFPIGAMMANEKTASAFEPGDHAATFGGNPLACTAGKTVLNKLFNENIIKNAEEQGAYLKQKLLELKQRFSIIIDVRGIGLMQGIELNTPVENIIKKCMDNGLLLISAGTNIIRFVPPLIIEKYQIDEAMQILTEIFIQVDDCIKIS